MVTEHQASTLSLNLKLLSLFEAVQLGHIFMDSKTFADCIPLYSEQVISEKYEREKEEPSFKLNHFVLENFRIPLLRSSDYVTDPTKSITEHINTVWQVLTQVPDQDIGGSLIPLPHPYIVPGGRFQEVYYWDTYFTMLGLEANGQWDLIENMVDNFAFLISRVGFIPNGNRTYYFGRSQPPFFALMIQMLQREKGDEALRKYHSYLEKEYGFWMDGENDLTASNTEIARVVRLYDGTILNRYWDKYDSPRPEAYREDVEMAAKSTKKSGELFRHIRAAAESGWDFSSRWFEDGSSMETINTTDILPVDLNCLLLHLEHVLLEGYLLADNDEKINEFRQRIHNREVAIHQFFWDEGKTFFFDYNFKMLSRTSVYSLAAVFPLFFKICSRLQAIDVSCVLRKKFLKQGGLLTTLNKTGQQWDTPNGWAPLHWIAYRGLRNYDITGLAGKIRNRWLDTNEKVYAFHGKMTEKYDVSDDKETAGSGGEYPNQDGFGWTNGVYLKLAREN
jgi:alpha,alpha-trehalase